METATQDPLVNITSVIERVGSIFSLLGCFFIIITFSYSSAFNKKPINRLVFYASFGNVICNVSTLMAGNFLEFPNSVGCQLQGALIQMFMPADAFWALSMAVNVWLTFYHNFDARRLREMEKWYLLLCYGCPFIPAVVFIFIENPAQGHVYGNATLWCWITPGWGVFRFALFYGPVWISILISFFIYARAGRDIYTKRKNLGEFGFGSGSHEPYLLRMTDPFSTKTTEIVVTSEPAPDYQSTSQHVSHGAIRPWRQRVSLTAMAHGTDIPAGQHAAAERPPTYSVTISADIVANSKSATSKTASMMNVTQHSDSDIESQLKREGISGSRASSTASIARFSNSSVLDQYMSQPESPKLPVQPTPSLATITTTRPLSLSRSHRHQRRPETANTTTVAAAIRAQRSRSAAVAAADKAAWSYTKCALLFFTAMLITWLPSTANRLYNLASGGETSAVLDTMTAIVLPIQGFWNCVIYCMTSREAVAELFAWEAKSVSLGICGGWCIGLRRPSGDRARGAHADAYAGAERRQDDERELQSPYRQQAPSQSAEAGHPDQAGKEQARPDSEILIMVPRKSSAADSTTELRPSC